MKLISKSFFFKRKTLIIFFFALVLPLLVIAYLGFNTLSERQKSTRKILESNLWITGESALNQLENELIMIEGKILSAGSFQRLISGPSSEEEAGYEEAGRNENPTLFLLDGNYEILFPKTGNDKNKETELLPVKPSQFDRAFKIAESYEFLSRDQTKAIAQYKKCFAIAKTREDQALSLEGMGRSCMSQQKYPDAAKYYQQLYSEYSEVFNKVGHPYGIIGLLQLNEIKDHLVTDEDIFPKLLDAYRNLKDGLWNLNTPSYNFFKSEIEAILESDLAKSDHANFETDYQSLHNSPSKYQADLRFSEFLLEDVILKIKESALLAGLVEDSQIRRIIGTDKGRRYMISYRQLPGLNQSEIYIGGLSWDRDTLIERVIKPVLDSLSDESGLNFHLLEDHDTATLSSLQLPKESLSLAFRRFPFPGRLAVVQPALHSMEKESRNEIFIYGIMLGMIIILMTMGAVLIARDIKRESDAMKLKTEFVHNVSHELKTPLSLIRLYGETMLLKKDLIEEEKNDALRVITKESERLSHMINNILDFSKIEMGRKEFHFQKGNLAKVIRDTLDSYRYHLEKKGFEIIEKIAQDIPLIYFDKEAIEGLMVNLLSNAVKFSPGEKVLTVRLFKDNNHILLEVSDTGIGIAPGEIMHIFNRFYRSTQKAGFESRGSGLGLTLVKHIAESHNGTIQVESKPGEGSTFTIVLPVSQSLS